MGSCPGWRLKLDVYLFSETKNNGELKEAFSTINYLTKRVFYETRDDVMMSLFPAASDWWWAVSSLDLLPKAF